MADFGKYRAAERRHNSCLRGHHELPAPVYACIPQTGPTASGPFQSVPLRGEYVVRLPSDEGLYFFDERLT